ncbi:MAG: hypothetical protein COV36_06245 [Alphaproteobacteria bacterium CG11_big_fil_rev_8_21_14_0_20_44_7]|nr:MAG: hypothetical protein COV36_06245 [Alphaproteobacteria bacterium CG11_big_fil_rev_8_21_14_0_20_44_7]
MSKFAPIFAVLVVVFFALPSFAAFDTKQAEHGDIKAWYIQDDSLPIISIKIAFENAGYAYDPSGKSGVANFVAGMLNEGTKEVSSRKFQKLLDDNAIEFIPSLDKDNFYISIKTLSPNLDLTLDLLNKALTEPLLGVEETERVRGQILTSINKRDESPNEIAAQVFAEKVFGSHPYAKSEDGVAGEVKSITPSDMRKFMKSHFAKDNIKIAIAGNVNQGRAQKIIAKIVRDLPKKADVVELPEFTSYPQAEIVQIEHNNPQTVVVFGHKGIKRSDKDFYAAYLLNHIIGGDGFQSILYREVREKQGLSYYIGTSFQGYEHADLFTGTLATKNIDVEKSINIVKAQLEQIAQGGVTQAELDNAKKYITGSFPLNLDMNTGLTTYLLMMQLEGLEISYLKNRNNFMESVTLEQVNAAAKRLITPERLLIVTVGGE